MKGKIWDWYAPIYKRAMRAEERSYAFLYRRIPKLIRGKEVLELATGPGLLAKRIAPVTKRMLATDYSEGMIAEAKKGACPSGRELRCGDHCECPAPFAGARARTARNSPCAKTGRYLDCAELCEKAGALGGALLGVIACSGGAPFYESMDS